MNKNIKGMQKDSQFKKLPKAKRGILILKCRCKDTAESGHTIQVGYKTLIYPCRRCYNGIKAEILSELIKEVSKDEVQKSIAHYGIENAFEDATKKVLAKRKTNDK